MWYHISALEVPFYRGSVSYAVLRHTKEFPLSHQELYIDKVIGRTIYIAVG